MSIAIFAPAVALSAVSGLQLELLIAVTGLICTFYTAVVSLLDVGCLHIFVFKGGLKAVVWTDAFQAIIMLIGFVMIIIEGWMQFYSSLFYYSS
jgi:sodium-coupled monocarboxylate transporter 8/12